MLRWPLKHFVKLLLGAVCVALLGSVPRSHAAEGTLPVPALRDLNDGMGWRNPQYYKTIQAIDLDGDGQSEVMSRWIDGLHIYRFRDGALVYHSFLPALSDKAGFYEPSWYGTIHAAVLDPKRRFADIVVRESDGIHIFRFATKRQTWREVGGSTARPFADHAADGTDWSQPQYYQTIRLTDLTKDGSAELIGRGKNGLVVYSWNNASERWQPLTTEGVLADGDGSERPDSYETIQLLDVNGDGVPEVLARSANGMQTLQWTGNGFTPLAVSGPFGNGEGSTLAHRYRSIHTFLDSGGQAWLYGMRAGSGAGQPGSVEVYRWKEGNWKNVSSIALPGRGWEKESQASVLLGANLAGDPAPELMVRTSHGLVAYTVGGKRLKDGIPGFSDAKGWNLEQQFATLQPATLNGTGATGTPAILGRGRDGLQALKLQNGWQAAADPFPQYCSTNPSGPTCLAYGCLSTIGAGVLDGAPITDIRSQYPTNSLTQGFWQQAAGNILEATTPRGPGQCGTVNTVLWQDVQQQLVHETSYVAVVAGWFDNNRQVTSALFASSGNLVNEVVGNLNNISGSTQINTEWAGFGLDIVSGLARFVPGGAGLSLVLSIIKDVINMSTTNDTGAAINQLYNDLDTQQNTSLLQNANQRQSYVTDWGQLQTIGSQQTEWANDNTPAIADAIVGGKDGFRIHFYKVIAPYKWSVSWCSQSRDLREVPCEPFSTDPSYFCQYGTPMYSAAYHSNASLTTGYFGPPLSWSTVDSLTGAGPDNLDASWYMDLLGSNLGWDFPAYLNANGNYYQQNESELVYANIEYGYNGPSSSCAGNGSDTGIQKQGHSIAQSLIVAQANTNTFHADYVRHLDRKLARLQEEVQASASMDGETRQRLLQMLDQAGSLLDRVYQGPNGAISATTPTLLMDWFVQQLETSGCDEPERTALATHAYALLGDLEHPPVAPATPEDSETK